MIHCLVPLCYQSSLHSTAVFAGCFKPSLTALVILMALDLRYIS